MVRMMMLIVITAVTVSLTVNDNDSPSDPSNLDPLTLRVLRHSSGVTNSITNSLGPREVPGNFGIRATTVFTVTRISGADIPGTNWSMNDENMMMLTTYSTSRKILKVCLGLLLAARDHPITQIDLVIDMPILMLGPMVVCG